MKKPRSAFRDPPIGCRTIGDALAEAGEVDGPMVIGMLFENAVSVLLRAIVQEPTNDVIGRNLQHLCAARKHYHESKGTS